MLVCYINYELVRVIILFLFENFTKYLNKMTYVLPGKKNPFPKLIHIVTIDMDTFIHSLVQLPLSSCHYLLCSHLASSMEQKRLRPCLHQGHSKWWYTCLSLSLLFLPTTKVICCVKYERHV